MKSTLFILSFALFSQTAAVATPSLLLTELPAHFPTMDDEVWTLQNQFLEVRGFWYPQTSGEGFLAPSSDLKSCCVGSPATIYRQVKVKGELSSLIPQHVVTLQGIFHIHPHYDLAGELVQLYVLEQAQVVPQGTSIVGPLILFSFFFLALWKRRHIFKREKLNGR